MINTVDYSRQQYLDWWIQEGFTPQQAEQAVGIVESTGAGYLSPETQRETSYYTALKPWTTPQRAATEQMYAQKALSQATTALEYAQIAAVTTQKTGNIIIPEHLQVAAPVKKVKTLQERVDEVQFMEFESEEQLWAFLYQTFSEQELRQLLGAW